MTPKKIIIKNKHITSIMSEGPTVWPIWFRHWVCTSVMAPKLRLVCVSFSEDEALVQKTLACHRSYAVWLAAPGGHRAVEEGKWRQQMERVRGLRAHFSGVQVSGKDFEFLGERLGDGPMSTVDLGRHKASQCYVALKSYTKTALMRHDRVEEAFNEKSALMQLDGHPLVIVLLATYQSESLLHFVLELCPGGDLVDAVRREPLGHFSMTRCWVVAGQLFEVVRFIHSKRIVHRDIKAENILLGSDGRIRLCDFATCMFLDADGGGGSCKRAFVGSAQYVAPEIIDGGQPTAAVDIWGAGCVAYYLAFGSHAFLRDTDYLTWSAALKDPLCFPTQPVAVVDASYRALLEQCLDKNPLIRATADHLVQTFFSL